MDLFGNIRGYRLHVVAKGMLLLFKKFTGQSYYFLFLKLILSNDLLQIFILHRQRCLTLLGLDRCEWYLFRRSLTKRTQVYYFWSPLMHLDLWSLSNGNMIFLDETVELRLVKTCILFAQCRTRGCILLRPSFAWTCRSSWDLYCTALNLLIPHFTLNELLTL